MTLKDGIITTEMRKKRCVPLNVEC